MSLTRVQVERSGASGYESIDALTIKTLRDTALAAMDERDALRAEIEVERMRLAGCGVAAMSNTAESIAQRIGPESPYYSASYGDVCRAVDREMALKAECGRKDAALSFILPDLHRLGGPLGQFSADDERRVVCRTMAQAVMDALSAPAAEGETT